MPASTQVDQLLDDHMDYIAFPLHLAIDAEHPCAHDERAAFLEHPWPYNQVGDPAFVLEGAYAETG